MPMNTQLLRQFFDILKKWQKTILMSTQVVPPACKPIASPRHKFAQTNREARSGDFTEVLAGPEFAKRIETFLKSSLENANSDSDRIFVYQRAFDMLAGEFQLCRPLLERIKQQYDAMGRALLAKKREIATDTSSISAAEENFSEAVSQLRRARAQEFAQNRAESERLLDQMTALRLQRSELLKQIEGLVTRREELQQCESDFDNQIVSITEKVEAMTDEVRRTESDVKESKKALRELKDKIEKAGTASSDLASKADGLKSQLSVVEGETAECKARLFDLNEQSGKIEFRVNLLKRDLTSLQEEKLAAIQKRDEAAQRHAGLESELRRLLKDDTTPLAELLRSTLL